MGKIEPGLFALGQKMTNWRLKHGAWVIFITISPTPQEHGVKRAVMTVSQSRLRHAQGTPLVETNYLAAKAALL